MLNLLNNVVYIFRNSVKHTLTTTFITETLDI